MENYIRKITAGHPDLYVVTFERLRRLACIQKSRHKIGHSSIIYEAVVKIPITSGPLLLSADLSSVL